MKSRARRLLRKVIQLAIPALLLYLGASNALLRSDWLAERINRRPERLQVSWQRAWSLWPGRVGVEGLRLQAANEKNTWIFTAQQLSTDISLVGLMRRRFAAKGTDASGVTVWRSAKADGGEADVQGGAPEAPPQPDEGDTAGAHPPGGDAAGAHQTADAAGGLPPPEHTWTIELEDLQLTDLIDLHVGDYRLQGHLDAALDLSLVPRQQLAMRGVQLWVREGQLTLDDVLVLAAVKGTAKLSLGPLNPIQITGKDLVRYLTGHVELAGEVKTLAFLNFYLQANPWFSIAGGEGELNAQLQLSGGTLLSGSQLQVSAHDVVADLDTHSASGAARIGLTVSENDGAPLTTLGVVFNDFVVRRGAAGPTLVQGQGLVLGARSAALQLSDPLATVDVTMELPESTAPDLRAFNAYLPEDSGVALGPGKGLISGTVNLSVQDHSASGHLSLSAPAAHVDWQSVDILGALALRAPFDCDLSDGRCELAGTRLDLDRVTLADGDPDQGIDQQGWWAHLGVTQGVATLGPRPRLNALLTTSFRDTGPLVSLFAETQSLPDWLQRLATLEGVEGTSRLIVDKRLLAFEDLHLSLPGTELKAQLRRTEVMRGVLFIRHGRLSAGLELEEGGRTLHLRDAQGWFDAHPPL